MMGFHIARLPASLLLAASALGLSATAAMAEYPPGAFPGPAPAGAFPTVLVSRTVCEDGDSVSVDAGSSTLNLDVPAGAFDACTQVTLYGVDETIVENIVPDGYVLLDAIAIGWVPLDQSAFDATFASYSNGSGASERLANEPAQAPLSLEIVNPAIDADAAVFQTTSGGLTAAADAQLGDGHVVVLTRDAVGIVVAHEGRQDEEGSTGQPGTLPSTDVDAPPLGPLGTYGLVVIVAIGVVAAGALSLLFVRRRRSLGSRR